MKEAGASAAIRFAAASLSCVAAASFIAGAFCMAGGSAQRLPWSQSVADSAIARWPAAHFTLDEEHGRRSDDLGALLDGMDATWYNSARGKYYSYIKEFIDRFVRPDGSIFAHPMDPSSMDGLLPGGQLLTLYRVTQEPRYYKAATLLRSRLLSRREDASGGRYLPFLAEYASIFEAPQDFAGITRKFIAIERSATDPKNDPLYGVGDASSRQLGWYMAEIVDALPYYPKDDAGRKQLLVVLNRAAKEAARNQDKRSGLWHRAAGEPHATGDPFASPTACILIYALAKGVRLGYLPEIYQGTAERGWRGIQKLEAEAGRRHGSGGVQVSSPAIAGDPAGAGAFLLAASEMELSKDAARGRGGAALLDAWYNSQKRKNAAGDAVYYHYKWDDYSDSGFSLFGHIFRSYGVSTRTLYTAPTLRKLKDARFYIIVSPDNPAKSSHPNYMNERDAMEIAAWVKQGGILLLMENDPANADITHLDLLADIFGLHFNNVLAHHVAGDNFAMGRIDMTRAEPPFTHPYVLYMKDTCSLALSKGAVARLTYQGDILMGSANYGKGLVFAVTDPWLYNEYTDGRKLPAGFDNFAAGREWVGWLLLERSRIPD